MSAKYEYECERCGAWCCGFHRASDCADIRRRAALASAALRVQDGGTMSGNGNPFHELARVALAISNGRNPAERLARLARHAELLKAVEQHLEQLCAGQQASIQSLISVLHTLTAGYPAPFAVRWQEEPVPDGVFAIHDSAGELVHVVRLGAPHAWILPTHVAPYTATVKWAAGGEEQFTVQIEAAPPPANGGRTRPPLALAVES